MSDAVLMKNITNSLNMGATNNANGARLVALQERKKSIEDVLSKKEKELRELCLQEADLTGIIPSEMPLQPGESPPTIRRKVGTSYMLPENLLKYTSNKDENIVDLELQLQLHANMAEAALGLAHKQNLSKTVRRQHKSEYQHHKKEYKALQEKIFLLKEAQHQLQQQQQHQDSSLIDQQKQKKKPRPPDQDDSISIKSNDAFRKNEHRQSIRSLRHTLQTDNIAELYPQFHQKLPDRSSEIPFDIGQMRYDDLSSSFYKLNLSGFKSYLERRENYGPMQPAYNQKVPSYQHIHAGPTYPTFQYNHSTYSPLQQASPQHSPSSPHHTIIQPVSPSSPDMPSLLLNQKYNNPRFYSAMINSPHFQSYTKYTNNNSIISISRQSSPNSNTNPNKFHFANYSVPLQNHVHKNQSTDAVYNSLQNPHQLQPHQQYEHNAGLGGCWKKKESGEVIWCNNSNIIDTNYQGDKRFGSLDRRKNRRIQKRISPNADNKSATLATIPHSVDRNTVVLHSTQAEARHSRDRQLVRTQSLGSVGVQTSDSVWPSDDNSSCESENRSIHERSSNIIRRHKQKEWRETSLDSPASPTSSIVSRSESVILPVLAPEEKYIPMQVTSPILTKTPLEIPAESNPSPRIPDTNLELFNNNIPKNCTIVQAGHCKPYHEETKPFEMSDFYKYSTKFKKSPSTSLTCEDKTTVERPHNFHINLSEHYDTKHVYHHSMLPLDCSLGSVFGQMDNISGNMDFGQMPINSQDNYPQDVNAWYSSQPSREKENNNATLV